MKLVDLISESKDTAFSFEILPSIKGRSMEHLHLAIQRLMEFYPKYVNITTHHSEFIQRTLNNGETVRQNIRKRPGTVAIAALIQNEYHIPAVPHVICAGFSRAETEYALIDLKILGVNNLLVLQGDKGKLEPGWIPEDQSNKYAIDLQHQINDFNHGKFEDGTLMDNEPDIPFSYGVAGYPEKHFEAKTLEEDIQHLKDKVDAGADYVVTQMFFDNKKYFKFVEMCRMKGINVPIIPGIKPLISKKQQTVIPQVFALQFPEELNNALTACKTDDDVKQVGVEWSINQCRELMRSGVPSLHFYTQNAVDSVVKIAREIY